MKVSRDPPLAEVTLRRYPKPFRLEGRELCRKVCLSIGLLQPGDSRDIVVDVLEAFVQKGSLEVEGLLELVKGRPGASAVNVRRQIRRLKDLNIVERKGHSYRLAEGLCWAEVFEERFKQLHVLPILDRVKEYFEALDEKG